MKYRLSAFLLALVLPFILTSCGEKDENLLDKLGQDHVIPTDIYDDPNVQINNHGNNSPDDKKSTARELSGSHLIKIDCILQNPELPTGCEITSLAMVLNYLGYDISKTTLASDYLTKDYVGKVGFDQAFIGDPTWEDGYGCFAPVIVNAANKYLNKHQMKYSAWNLSGTDFKELFKYIDIDIPVIVWASMGLMEVYKNPCFVDANGNQVYWYDNEHCVVLCGYDISENTVTAADPLDGIVKYDIDDFEAIYNKLEKQAVILE